MSMKLTERAAGQDENESRDTLFLLGGAAMVLFGAGLILSTQIARRYLGDAGVGNLAQAAIPDIERYIKLRAM